MTPPTRQNAPRRLSLWPALAAGALVAALAAPPQAAPGAAPPEFGGLTSAAMDEEIAPQSAGAARSMRRIPAGEYPIGRNDGALDEAPSHRVQLSGFRLDLTPVTNAAFAEYLNALNIRVVENFEAGGFRPEFGADETRDLLQEGRSGSGLYPIIALDDAEARIEFQQGRFRATPGFEAHPATETTWAGALAYCRWRGARLPSEAEWEAAARGTDGRLYPWGDQRPDGARAFVSGRTGETAVVGQRPAGASPFGVLDMSGLMAEWTSSLKRPYPYDANDGREALDAPGERVTRGGDYRFDTAPATLTATHRDGFSNAPERGHRHIGFRCAAEDPAA